MELINEMLEPPARDSMSCYLHSAKLNASDNPHSLRSHGSPHAVPFRFAQLHKLDFDCALRLRLRSVSSRLAKPDRLAYPP